ncbi:MAG: glutamine synthetase, partial [Candidatus Aminicenantes bacterium]
GLEGVKKKYPLLPPVEENIYQMSPSRQKKLNIKTLPRNLEEGIRLMEKSPLLKETLRDHLFQNFLANKKWEIDEYKKHVSNEFDKQVSEYEIKKYLPFL